MEEYLKRAQVRIETKPIYTPLKQTPEITPAKQSHQVASFTFPLKAPVRNHEKNNLHGKARGGIQETENVGIGIPVAEGQHPLAVRFANEADDDLLSEPCNTVALGRTSRPRPNVHA